MRAVIYYLSADLANGTSVTLSTSYDFARGDKDPGFNQATMNLLNAALQLPSIGKILDYSVERREVN